MTMSDAIVVMRDGRIQQLGTPRELYERPWNRFVAEFIGQSNSLRGQLLGPVSNGSASVQTEPGLVLRGWISDPDARPAPESGVIVAIRPERIELHSEGMVDEAPTGWTSVGGRIRQGTYLGDATEFRIETALGELVARQHHDPRSGLTAGLAPGSAVVARWRDDANIVLIA